MGLTGVACYFSTTHSTLWMRRADSAVSRWSVCRRPDPGDDGTTDRRGCLHPGRGARRHHPPGQRQRVDADPRHELAFDRTISDSAAYGTWAFRFGDPESERSGPAYFEEIVAEAPVCTVSLDRLPDSRTGGLTLATAAFPTDGGSPTRNRVQPLYGSTHLVIQKLRELHDFGWERVARAANDWPQHPVASAPTSKPVQVCALDGAAAGAQGCASARDVGDEEQARMAMADRDPGGRRRWARPTAGRYGRVSLASAPPGRSYADPFLMRQNDRTWLFFEDQARPRDAGVISCVQIAADGPVGQPVVVVQSAGHLSYPYVFSEGDNAYMIPESSAENAVRLYRATNFPYEWEMVKELYPVGP